MKKSFLTKIFIVIALVICVKTVLADQSNINQSKQIPSVIYMTGSATSSGWTNTSPEKMIYKDGKYVWEGHLNANGEIKFLTELNNWYKCYNAPYPHTIIDSKVNYQVNYNASGYNDHKFVVQRSGNYIVTLDTSKNILFVKEKDKTRVFCVGTSVTEAYIITEKYPQTLEKYLGEDYAVYNFGKGGGTILKNGDFPYWVQTNYIDLKQSEPDIIILKLGANDTKQVNWGNSSANFKNDMIAMIDELSNLPSKPKIYLGIPCFIQTYLWEENSLNSNAGINMRGLILRDYIIPIIKEVAKEKNLPTMDFYELTNGRNNLYYDGVHTTNEGAAVLAKYVNSVMQKQPVVISAIDKYFESAVRGLNNQEKLVIKAHNLTGDLNVSVSGKGFSISTTTIPKEKLESIDGFELTINCLPELSDAFLEGKIVITGGGLSENHEVNLKATPRDLYIVGSATTYGWDLSKAEQLRVDGHQIVWTGLLNPGAFKFLTSKYTWFDNYYSLTPNLAVVADGVTTHPMRFILSNNFSNNFDYHFIVSEKGLYTIKMNTITQTMTLEKEEFNGLWATGSALDGKILKLDLDPSSSSANEIFSYLGPLKKGVIKFMTTNGISKSTKFITPIQIDSSIAGNTSSQLTNKNKGWNVPVESENYRIKVSFGNVEGKRIEIKNELFLVGGVTDAKWDLNKALPFTRDVMNPYIFTIECNLKITTVFSIIKGYSSDNSLKILGQRSWLGYSFHPSYANALLSDLVSYRELGAPAASYEDHKWSINSSKQGRYKITVNTLDETILAEYLGGSAGLRNLFETNNLEDDVQAYGVDKQVYVSLPSDWSNVTSQLMSINGVLLDSSSSVGKFTLGQGLPTGVYIVRIQSDKGNITKKVQVK